MDEFAKGVNKYKLTNRTELLLVGLLMLTSKQKMTFYPTGQSGMDLLIQTGKEVQTF
jgi:hypothetical protein